MEPAAGRRAGHGATRVPARYLGRAAAANPTRLLAMPGNGGWLPSGPRQDLVRPYHIGRAGPFEFLPLRFVSTSFLLVRGGRGDGGGGTPGSRPARRRRQGQLARRALPAKGLSCRRQRRRRRRVAGPSCEPRGWATSWASPRSGVTKPPRKQMRAGLLFLGSPMTRGPARPVFGVAARAHYQPLSLAGGSGTRARPREPKPPPAPLPPPPRPAVATAEPAAGQDTCRCAGGGTLHRRVDPCEGARRARVAGRLGYLARRRCRRGARGTAAACARCSAVSDDGCSTRRHGRCAPPYARAWRLASCVSSL